MSQQTNLLQAPDPVETADVHFKLCCKLKIFESSTKHYGGYCSLLAVSQHYGLIFIGNLNGFTVIKTKSINGKTSFSEYPRRDIVLNSTPTHISIDCSQKLLAVVSSSKTGVALNLYNIASFTSKDVVAVKAISLSKTQSVVELTWQPNSDSILMFCMSDGFVLALSPDNPNGFVNTLPTSIDAKCFCWSPKGKQIVIGCGNGTISQYKPDLKFVKTLPAPPLYNGNVSAVGVLWISSFQFAVAYNDKSADGAFPVIMIVNAAKNEPVTFINYDDITFSTALFRNHQIYMIHQSAWNLIFVSSANGIEVALLHSNDGSSWQQWLLGDASRAELPLNADHQETFPLGLAIDLTSEEVVSMGEKTLPPMPRILLLSDEGVLCVFTVVNVMENVPQLCAPPQENVDDFLFSVPPPVPGPSEKTEQIPQNLAAQLPPAPAVVFPSPTAGVVLPPASAGILSPPTAGVVPPLSTAAISTPPTSILAPTHVFGTVKPSFPFVSSTEHGFASSPITITFPKTTSADPKSQYFQEVQQLPQQQQQQQAIVISTQGNVPSSTSFKFLSNAPQFGAPTTSSPLAGSLAFKITGRYPNIFGPVTVPTSLQGKPLVTITPVLDMSTPKSGSPTVGPGAGGVSVSLSKSPSQVDVGAGKTTNLFQSMTTKPVESLEKPGSKPVKIAEETSEAIPKPDFGKGKASGESPVAETPEVAVVDDSVYLNALQEEIEHFNSELRQLSERMGSLDIQIGTEEDKAKQRKRLESLYEFWKDLKETTASQSSEIHSVVTDLMESFAWLEDAKSRNLQRKNPGFVELKKSEELDPISARHMSDIAHLKYYIESQLKQLTSHLEKEWMDHQDSYRMEVKNRMTVPPLEEVYKTMHYQLKILNKQRNLIEELKEKMATKKRKDKTQMTLIANSNSVLSNSHTGNTRVSELSKLADNLLQLKITKEEHLVGMKGWEAMRAQLNAIAERSKKLSEEKQTVLRDVLSERDMVKIRPVKTTFESSSFLRSLPTQKSGVENSKNVRQTEEKTKKKEDVTKSVEENSKPIVKENAEKENQENKEEGKKNIFVFGKPPLETTTVPVPVPVPEKENKSPLASLLGIVSSIGKENEVQSKPIQSSAFGATPQVQDTSKGFFGLGSQQSKQEPPQTFTFTIPKPEPNFGSKTNLFAAKPTFGVAPIFTTPKIEVSKSSPTSSVVATTAAVVVTTSTTTTTSSAFGFTFAATTTSATSAPKMNLLFYSEEKSSDSKTGNVFSGASKEGQGTTTSIFGNVAPIFGNKTGFETQTTSIFGAPKSSETVSQTSSISFGAQSTENKTVVTPEVSVVTSSKKETEEVDVVTVEETVKKSEEGKGSPKVIPTPPLIFGGAVSVPKSVAEVPTTTAAAAVVTTSNVQIASTVQNSSATTTTNVFTKSVMTTSVEPPKPSTPAVVSPAGTTATSATSSSFSLTASSTPLVFGQAAAAAATTTPTTVASIFGQAPSTTSTVFGQVSSTTPPTTNIFGGATTPATSATIFEGSPASKPIFGQASVPTTPTSGSIFGSSAPTTPTTNTFGQVSTPPTSTPSVFGQKPDAVAQTANIFGQLLSDSNRSGTVFGSPSTTSATTTANIFSTPSNIFGGGGGTASTTTSSIFGSSVFGQPTTSASIFGSAATSTSFFGQNVCSPFGSGGSGVNGTTAVASTQNSFQSSGGGGFGSKPIFGQSVFGQTTSNTSFFGGSQNSSSIFGSSSTSGGNVFQTPTTNTFGSTSPGRFSSGQDSVAETGFQAANTFQKPLGGFGSPPVFGRSPTSTPAFGAAPNFAGSASFGALPNFGSRPLFDSSQTGAFGQTQGHSTTFENLANQNTVGFGNLAQQSQNQGFRVGGFGGAPAFENKPSFGGNSFSSWRSS